MPTEGVLGFLQEGREVTPATLSAVVQRFLVSPAIAAIALEQAGYIDHATGEQWRRFHTPQLAARFGWTDQYRALQAESNTRRTPQRLLARAINGHALGLLPAQTIATLRNVPLKEAEADLQEAGIAPTDLTTVWTNAADLPDVDVDLSDLSDLDDAPPCGDGPGAPTERDAG